MVERPTFQYPKDEYFKGVALTMAAFHYLNRDKADYENFEINVMEACSRKDHGIHTVKLCMDDYPELVREIIESIMKT